MQLEYYITTTTKFHFHQITIFLKLFCFIVFYHCLYFQEKPSTEEDKDGEEDQEENMDLSTQALPNEEDKEKEEEGAEDIKVKV